MNFYGSVIFLTVMMANLPAIRGQMGGYYNYNNDLYDQYNACQNGAYGSSYNCGFGTRNQNWFGSYHLGKANPYGFVSTMPYGYGSGAQPFFSDPYSGGWPGTSYAPGGYLASAVNNNFYPNPNVRY